MKNHDIIFNIQHIRGLILFITLVLLSACGGGDANQGNSGQDNPDTTPPVVTLNGPASVALNQGDIYIEQGATATDDRDGAIKVTISGSVDTAILGNYTLTYQATDNANNTGTATRTVSVELPPDTTPPVVTLNGPASITLDQGEIYTDQGATAIDDRDGSLSVTITGVVDTGIPDTYTIRYSATDSSSNSSFIERTVTVLPPDITAPDITLIGPGTITLNLGSIYIEYGANAIDNRDGALITEITGSVDTSTAGSYTVYYSANDKANNRTTISRSVIVLVPRPFITTWKTDNPGFTATDQVMINTTGTGYNYSVDWGDGNVSNNITGDIIHTYSSAGTYTLTISGDFPRIRFGAGSDGRKLISIEQWGTIIWDSMYRAFANCQNLVINATDAPVLTQVTDLSYMFEDTRLLNQDISFWDVSAITHMRGMFLNAISFNQDISSWNVSSVINMSDMFLQAAAFNQSLNGWDVSAVTDMSGMFRNASSFNGNISNWNVSSVTTMQDMFSTTDVFDQDISNWDVSNVTNMSGMFTSSAFNQDISNWNVSSVTNMSYMFSSLSRPSTFNQDLSKWDVSSVTDMSGIFASALAFNQDISTWDVSSVTNMAFMFRYASAFNQDIGQWDVSSVTNMHHMFSFTDFNQDIGMWDVSAVRDMSDMFRSNASFNQDLSKWDVSSVQNMNAMFSATAAFNQDIGGWDVSSVNDMSEMFMASQFNRDIGLWDVSSVVTMKMMFSGLYGTNPFNQDISNWKVSSVTDMSYMFFSAVDFNQDISSWNVSKVTTMSNMFKNASSFDQNIGSWDVSNVSFMNSMFTGATLSVVNYDALLSGWSSLSLKHNVNFHAGNSQYPSSAQLARDILTTTYNWTVTDAGIAP